MGKTSKDYEYRNSLRRPSDRHQMCPTPRWDDTGRRIVHETFDINRDQFLLAFQHVAEYLNNQGATLTIYVAGGALNTIYLRSRRTTGDVDFFGANEQSDLLRAASKYAQQRSEAQLGANWINNSMSFFLNPEMERVLKDESHRQKAVIFQQPGLIVYAVPWEYAFCGKTDRLTKPERQPYDAADAAAYLHECIRANGERAIKAHRIVAWTRKYNKAVSPEVLMEINALYRRQHGKHGIQFGFD